MNTMAGAFPFACSNRSRTRAAPTPTNISTKSLPLIEKNGTPASPATARARRVLPVPGGPYSRMPFGTLAPIAWNLAGFSRYSLTSSSSSTASSTPATSAKVVFGWSFPTIFALALPNDITLFPPPCSWFMKNSSTAKSRRMGNRFTRIETSAEPFWASVVTAGWFEARRICAVRLDSYCAGYVVSYRVLSASVPTILWSRSRNVTVWTSPACSAAWNAGRLSWCGWGPRVAKLRKTHRSPTITSR